MTARRRLAPLGLAALLAAGCAARAARPSAVVGHLPDRYRAAQVIRVTMASGAYDFLASVVREGRHVEVVLFDPALQVPLLRAVGDGDEASETVLAPGVPPGNGERLVELLRRLHEAGYDADGAAGDGAWRFTLSGFDGPPGCRFPARILVEHRHGGPRVEVETTDVACDAAAP